MLPALMVGEKATALISSGQERLETLPYHFLHAANHWRKLALHLPPNLFHGMKIRPKVKCWMNGSYPHQ